jgi:hypothetical protein
VRSHPVASSVRPIFILVLVPFLLTACGPFSSNASDPCLLAQYQSRGQSILHTIDSEFSTLSSRTDALNPHGASIDSTQDISETINGLARFQTILQTQVTLINHDTQPPEGRRFRSIMHEAAGQLNRGLWMLTEAYVDARTNPLAANAAAGAARDPIRQGRLLLAQAGREIAGIVTLSPNC